MYNMTQKDSRAVMRMLAEFHENMQKLGRQLTPEEMSLALQSLEEFDKAMEKEKAWEALCEAEELAEAQARAHEREVGEQAMRLELPMDWENAFLGDARAAEHVENVSDALVHSLNTLGRVDMEYICAVTGRAFADVVGELRGAIYHNPATWGEDLLRGWETAEEYLSGNLAEKWREAQSAVDTYGEHFRENVTALQSLLPPSVAIGDIYITLGSPWVPTDVIDQFIDYMVGRTPSQHHHEEYQVRHDERLGLWEVPAKNRFRYTRYQSRSNMQYGTAQMEMLQILENTLNMRPITIYDTVASVRSRTGKQRVVNEAQTVLALEKQSQMIEAFQKWVWRDKERAARLRKIYDARYGAIRQRRFDGSFLTFPQMSPEISLYPYQKNAVARMILTPNTLLAHDVGAGKTYEMVAAGMEMRRMGISKKNLYVVPCSLVAQWRDIFLRMYPAANLLCVGSRDFTPQKRKTVLEKIRDEDFDAVIMGYSAFDMIPLSFQYYENKFYEEEEALRESGKVFQKSGMLSRKSDTMLNHLADLEEEMKKLNAPVYFDELGINTLFVDEAHNYKNVPIDTKVGNVRGISSSGSEKCKQMLDKVRAVQKHNGGRGVILATGTPITNSITDIYVMQQYLQSGELALLGLQSFDSWIGMFAEKKQDFELDVDTSKYRMVTRFARFHNLPELTGILASISDFYHVPAGGELPDFAGYTDVLVKKSEDLAAYLLRISERADDVRHHRVKRSEDNMLKITGDGRRAALDLRLVEEKAPFVYQCKAVRCAETVSDIYWKTKQISGTQLVFCDTSVPREGFNMYDEMKRLLKLMGVKEEEIAYVHDANTEARREKLFAAVRRGEIRVLLGSTFKLGTGVNVQDKLVAIHHLDVPWRPADMVQRLGRILRQGNTNPEVFAYRYIAEGTFDAYSYQLLETKQRFIAQLLSGAQVERSGSDVDDTVLSYAEVKALAVGNPLLKQRVEVANELMRKQILHREAIEERQRLGQELLEMPHRIKEQQGYLDRCRADIAYYAENKREYEKEELKALREHIDTMIRNNQGFLLEREIAEYQGFRVVAPALMDTDKPYVWLVREGRYYLELGSAVGVMRRIDFFLDELSRQEKGFMEMLERLEMRKLALEEEQQREIGCLPEIEMLRKKLAAIDKKLGVKDE